MPDPVFEVPFAHAMRCETHTVEIPLTRQIELRSRFPDLTIAEKVTLPFFREVELCPSITTIRIPGLVCGGIAVSPDERTTADENHALNQIHREQSEGQRREQIEALGVSILPQSNLEPIRPLQFQSRGYPDKPPLFTPEAEERAAALLLRHLDDEQTASYLQTASYRVGGRNGSFDVAAPSGIRYTLDHRRSINVSTNQGRHYCLELPDAPIADQLLVQKILLETDEAGFLERAREWPRTRMRQSLASRERFGEMFNELTAIWQGPT